MTLATGQSTALDTDKSLPAGSDSLDSALARAIRYVADVIAGGIDHIEGNMVPVCICAAIMFPVYWYVWKFLFPQPYENIWIRLGGSALCLVVAAKDHWPQPCRRYLPVIWLGTVLYCGPFFFTFMLLQNNTSTVWLMSTMAGLFMVLLLLDWISLFVLFIAGSALAWHVHLLLSPGGSSAIKLYLEYVPIFLFALTTGTIFNYQAAALRRAKERARIELGAFLAKEMQSPLFEIRTHAASLSKFLPSLISVYGRSHRQEAVPAFSPRQLGALERVPARLEEAVEQMDGIIEMLMTEGGQVGAGRRRASSMLHCLDEAVARLPFLAELDRARLVIDRSHDFLFHGSPILMAHVLARVLEAALSETYHETGAELVVSLGQADTLNYLRLADSSAALSGTTPRLRSRLWGDDRSFSGRPDLALASLVLQRVGGSVTRTVAFGHTTETVLWFAPSGG